MKKNIFQVYYIIICESLNSFLFFETQKKICPMVRKKLSPLLKNGDTLAVTFNCFFTQQSVMLLYKSVSMYGNKVD